MADTPKVASVGPIKLPTLEVATTRVLSPPSLTQVKQAIVPMVQQLVQGAGIKLSAADQEAMNAAFMARGIINIPASADAGNSLNVETNSLTWSSRQIAVAEEE